MFVDGRRRGDAMHLHQPPFVDALPAPVVFRTADMPADATYPLHSHPWGEFVYAFSGVMEVRVAGRHYLAPSQYGLWLPPGIEHRGLNHQAACHCSLYVSTPLADALPVMTCALSLTPMVMAMLDHLRHSRITPPYDEAGSRLLRVLVDQLAVAGCAGSYLPTSDDPQLGRVLAMLDADPGCTLSLAELARAVNTTERTLMRRSQRDLNMSLAEWRQRLRVLKAMPRLTAGEKVEAVALDLGYGSASAFIAMFRRLTGVTPDDYRRGARKAGG
ncbi:helix-turn-helix transcriptional regulator [Tistrella bauzanensis]|uniref:Helix-turn-helix transcriptional regulator n=1 Tax=Tistrella arctica TaxID=3133430 RepID=A0ABU9YD88_9PROT